MDPRPHLHEDRLLVTTSVEEIPWITHWCEQEGLPYVVEEEDYPTAIVEDPICLIQIGV